MRPDTLVTLERSQELMPEKWVAIPVEGIPLPRRKVFEGLVHPQLHRALRAPPLFRSLCLPFSTCQIDKSYGPEPQMQQVGYDYAAAGPATVLRKNTSRGLC